MKQIFTILGVLIFCGLFAQEIPQKISYQGKLLEDGYAVNGTKDFTFTIGAWSETHSSVQVTDGLYSVTLGETTPIPISIFNNSSSVTLQIKVEGTTLSPTTEILSVPYTYKAEEAVNTKKIAGRTVSTTTPSTNQVLKWNGSSWSPGTDESGGSYTAGTGINISGSTISAQNTTALWNANKLQGKTLSTSNPSSGQVLKWNGSSWAPGTDNEGSGGDGESLSQTLAIGNSAGNYGIDMSYEDITNVNYIEMEGDIQMNGDIEFTDEDYDIRLKDGSDILFYNGANSLEGVLCANNATNLNGLDFFKTAGLFISDTWNRNDKHFSLVAGDLWVSGNITSGKKQSKNTHPYDPTKEIVYVCLEGGESGTYTRGTAKLKDGIAEIELPKHFSLMTSENNLTAQITPRGNCNGIYIEFINNSKLIVKELMDGRSNIEFDYYVNGIKKGYENHEVIREKNVYEHK